MPRLISFIVLTAVVLLVSALFFRVMLEFLVPMFLAAVLVVVFGPLHKWFQLKLAGHPRVAAAATTFTIVLIVLIPFVAITWNAYLEIATFARQAIDEARSDQKRTRQLRADESPNSRADQPADPGTAPPEPSSAEEDPKDVLADELLTDEETSAKATSEDDQAATVPSELDRRMDAIIRSILEPLQQRLGLEFPDVERIRAPLVRAIISVGGEAGSAALVGAQWIAVNVIRLLIGLAIMVISIYYFLADGPAMIVTVMQLSPLDDRYELELFERFSNISRSVVSAVLLSAFVQGVLAGLGYYFAGVPAVFTLTGLTMLLAVVPFLGAASVWVPTAAWLYLAQGRPVAAIVLALYGAGVVSAIDNVIKPLVLHGQSNLHPLLALLSVLGGVAALGPVGILVGPMAVAFLQALLGMLRREILELGRDDRQRSAIGTPLPAGATLATGLDATGEPPRHPADEAPPASVSAGVSAAEMKPPRPQVQAGRSGKRRRK